ncbi:MAG TPA: hypothetical protein VLA99_01650 [Nitrospiraceae bacterium]|nr:hypothetical protein [Nitrospiraceae bacterium]
MATSLLPYKDQIRALAELMLAIAGESVTLVKKSAPDRALKLKRKEEWEVYLEFLKILFNLADRLSAMHVPLADQPEFMNQLEDAVSHRLKSLLAQAISNTSDPMELVMTVGLTVAESRRLYEPFKFMVTEDSKQKQEMLAQFGTRIAQVMGDPQNGQISASAVLCAGAVIPAMNALFEGRQPEPQLAAQPTASQGQSERSAQSSGTGNEIKLVSVVAAITGEEVETRWGLHPRFRRDLTAQEAQELTRLMNRVTKILGERYAAVAFSDHWATWHEAGHA